MVPKLVEVRPTPGLLHPHCPRCGADAVGLIEYDRFDTSRSTQYLECSQACGWEHSKIECRYAEYVPCSRSDELDPFGAFRRQGRYLGMKTERQESDQPPTYSR